MRKFITALALTATSLLGFTATSVAAKPLPTGTISIDQPGPYAFGDHVSFTTTSQNVQGVIHTMVLVECWSVVDGTLLVGQLDFPDADWILGGGGWSPWFEPEHAGEDGYCVASLLVYGGKYGGSLPPYFLDATDPFFVTGP